MESDSRNSLAVENCEKGRLKREKKNIGFYKFVLACWSSNYTASENFFLFSYFFAKKYIHNLDIFFYKLYLRVDAEDSLDVPSCYTLYSYFGEFEKDCLRRYIFMYRHVEMYRYNTLKKADIYLRLFKRIKKRNSLREFVRRTWIDAHKATGNYYLYWKFFTEQQYVTFVRFFAHLTLQTYLNDNYDTIDKAYGFLLFAQSRFKFNGVSLSNKHLLNVFDYNVLPRIEAKYLEFVRDFSQELLLKIRTTYVDDEFYKWKQIRRTIFYEKEKNKKDISVSVIIEEDSDCEIENSWTSLSRRPNEEELRCKHEPMFSALETTNINVYEPLIDRLAINYNYMTNEAAEEIILSVLQKSPAEIVDLRRISKQFCRIIDDRVLNRVRSMNIPNFPYNDKNIPFEAYLMILLQNPFGRNLISDRKWRIIQASNDGWKNDDAAPLSYSIRSSNVCAKQQIICMAEEGIHPYLLDKYDWEICVSILFFFTNNIFNFFFFSFAVQRNGKTIHFYRSGGNLSDATNCGKQSRSAGHR